MMPLGILLVKVLYKLRFYLDEFLIESVISGLLALLYILPAGIIWQLGLIHRSLNLNSSIVTWHFLLFFFAALFAYHIMYLD